MTDAEPLLRMIWDSPFDDGPRLVYADWLEEQGESERAEIIRVQIELSQIQDGDPRWLTLKQREAELLPLTRGWMKRLPPCPDSPLQLQLMTAPFERGFPLPVLRLEPWKLQSYGDVLSQTAPLFRIQLSTLNGPGLAVAELPFLIRFKEFSASNFDLDDDAVRTLLRSPHFIHLTRLDLRFNRLQTPTAFALSNGTNLQRLRQVDVRWNHLDAEGVRILTDRFGDGAYVEPQNPWRGANYSLPPPPNSADLI